MRNAQIDVKIPRPVVFDDYAVKFNEKNLSYEADTQVFIHEALEGTPNAPHVPKVFDYFRSGIIHYIVMERLKLPTVKEWIEGANGSAEAECRFNFASQAVAEALRWLFTLSPPVGTEIGLIEGNYTRAHGSNARENDGCAWNSFFGMYPAPMRYSSPYALQLHINQVP